MGKEWLSWGGGGGGSTRREKMKEAATASAGCMSAVYNILHFHGQLHRNSHPNSYPFHQEEATKPTGLEAPRNSLELAVTAAASIKSAQNLNIPVGIKIKTRLDGIDSESSSCNSPGTKTPSVVARLMGLDLLPESNSPSFSSHRKDAGLLRSSFSDDLFAVRSLPETPRTSSSSRKSDIERHRLSLQINKENASKDEFSLSDRKTTRRRGRFTKDDAVERSFGLDITNTKSSRCSEKSSMNQNLLLLKPKTMNPKISSKNGAEGGGDPRLPRPNIKTAGTTKISRISSAHDINHQARDSKKVNNGKCLKKLPPRAAAVDRATKSRREDGFVRSRERNKLHLAEKKSEKTLARFKNGPTRLHTKSIDVSTEPSHKVLSASPCSTSGGATALHGVDSRNYVEKILKHSGIINQANPLTGWHTPSHPIDPAIFSGLEFQATSVSGHRSERKLIFQLVDELLGQTFTGRFGFKRWVSPLGCFPAVEELCKRIDSFPAARCVVLEDIDSLIERDLCESQLNWYWGGEEEMVCEIEGEIVEWLVGEAVAVMGMGGAAAAEEETETGVLSCGVLTLL